MCKSNCSCKVHFVPVGCISALLAEHTFSPVTFVRVIQLRLHVRVHGHLHSNTARKKVFFRAYLARGADMSEYIGQAYGDTIITDMTL